MIFEKITNPEDLARNYTYKDGFVFTAGEQNNIFDVIVIKVPFDVPCFSPVVAGSKHSLEEHIAYINVNKIEKALIIAENIDFLIRCPSLKCLVIVPPDIVKNFDYSVLYQIRDIRELNCVTEYGCDCKLISEIDYSKIRGLRQLNISGKGHKNFQFINTLETLNVSSYKGKKGDLTEIFCSKNLKELALTECGIKNLKGIEQAGNIENLILWHDRSLKDISCIRTIAESLKRLSIEACPKIEDWSVLYELTNLEFLELNGSNVLPSLDFLKKMKKLETFIFTINIDDGNLRPCLSLKHAFCGKNRKHYNLKDKDLPKLKKNF